MKLIKPTKIDEYQETKADRIIESVFIIGLSSICIILVLLILFSTRSQASSSNAPLPLTNYTAPRYLTSEEIAFFNEMVANKPSLFGNHSVNLSSEGIYCFNVQLDNKIVNTRQWQSVMGYVFYKPYSYSVGTLSYDSFNLFSSATVELYFAGYEKWEFWQCAPNFSSGYNGWYGGYGSSAASTTISLFGLGTDVTVTNSYNTNTFKQGYPIYWSSSLYNGTSSVPIVNQPLLSYGKPAFGTSEGHATDNGSTNNIDSDWNPRPSKPNLPTPTVHTWTPAPPIDTSTIETLLESIHDLLSWLSDNIKDEFSNLISNFSDWFDYLFDLIAYFFLALLDSIDNLKDFIFDNLVSLFEPLFENISKITDFFVSLLNLGQDSNGDFSFSLFLQKLIVPDPADLIDIIEDNDEYNLIGIFEFLNTAITAFNDTITNNTRKYITIPQCTFMGVNLGPYQIDFSWYDDYKVYGDGVISALLIFGYLFFLYTRISGILNHEGNSANKAEGGHL